MKDTGLWGQISPANPTGVMWRGPDGCCAGCGFGLHLRSAELGTPLLLSGEQTCCLSNRPVAVWDRIPERWAMQSAFVALHFKVV